LLIERNLRVAALVILHVNTVFPLPPDVKEKLGKLEKTREIGCGKDELKAGWLACIPLLKFEPDQRQKLEDAKLALHLSPTQTGLRTGVPHAHRVD
jgi:hypothetical protein